MDAINVSASTKTNLMSGNKRRKWTQDETKLFLKCFLARQHEFRSRKKKFAYKRVLKDMIAQGFKDKNVTHSNLECKMRTLSIAYNACKDDVFPKKASAYIKPFIEDLDIIFGSQMNFMSQQTSTEPVSDTLKTEKDYENEMDSSSPSDTYDPLQAANVATEAANLNETNDQDHMTFDMNTDENIPDKLSAQHEYYEAKLEYKRRQLELKTKFYAEMMAIEKQKIELLTKIADKLCKS